MPSSLIPEKPLIISPSLAATIGLEEAVMLQGLHDAMNYLKAEVRDGYKWYLFEKRELEQRFPFWPAGDVQRVAFSLKDKGVIVLDENNYLLSGLLKLALNEKVVSAVSTSQPLSAPITAVAPAPAPKATMELPKKGSYKISSGWQPDAEIVKQIKQLGIGENFIRECLPEFIQYWSERNEAHHGWGSKFRSWIVRRWREQETVFAAQQRNTEITGEWQPDIDAVEILTRAGIDRQFIEDAIPEFVLYWRERGDATSTWNSKFVQHIRLQWARFTNATRHEHELRTIPADWQPSPEVFEILQMANIDAAFAKSLVPEFILYWRETRQLHTSWNSKFLQHTKYHWAKRHHMKIKNDKDSLGFIERHTDKSWADGL
jgi:hypothetical protein